MKSVQLPPLDIFRPDKHKLDEELQEQPRLCRMYSDALANAQKDLDIAEADLEFVEADLDKRIRSHPEDYGIDKVTENVIKREIVLHKKYQEANKVVIEARHQVNQLKGITNSVEHRKKSIESLVYLFGQDYWAEPRIEGSGRSKAVDQKIDRVFGKKRS